SAHRCPTVSPSAPSAPACRKSRRVIPSQVWVEARPVHRITPSNPLAALPDSTLLIPFDTTDLQAPFDTKLIAISLPKTQHPFSLGVGSGKTPPRWLPPSRHRLSFPCFTRFRARCSSG